jgi:Mlc titration factor MtfA (ptsG expression regulator)
MLAGMSPMGWFRRRRRRKLLARSPPAEWEAVLERRVAFYRKLDRIDRRDLFAVARVIVAEKNWEPAGGLEAVSDEAKLVIAAQAALLILRIDHDYYANIRSIVVHPRSVRTPWHEGDFVGEAAVLGQAHPWGPVMLTLDAVMAGAERPHDGRNLVLHEFAHALDFVDHHVDGTPALSTREQYRLWVRVMSEHYERLIDDAERRRASLLDHYGATNPAEFFAVATEAFFEKSDLLRRRHEELYGVLAGYYRQDPAAWSSGAPGEAR